MKLKQLFCRHKKLTAIKIYEHINPYITSTWKDVRIICKCNKCEKELEFTGNELQYLKNNKKQINTDKIINSKLWGKWW